jgi:hypothetical protein
MNQETQEIINLMFDLENNPIHYSADGTEAAKVFKQEYPNAPFSLAAIKRAWRVGCDDLDVFVEEEFGEEIARQLAKCN